MGSQKKEKPGKSSLKKGDTVMVIAGGSADKRVNKGKTGKILRFVGDRNQRVIVEGLNFFAHHQKAKGPGTEAGKVVREGSIHISNVMFYVETLKKPVRLKHKKLKDGKKVRGYINSESKEFVQVD